MKEKIDKQNREYFDNDDFEERRKIGENQNVLCEYIREDKVDEFIVYVTKKNVSLNSKIKPSIFETNPFLYDKNPSLIEYSAFFGSILIFNYLKMNKADLKSSLWLHSIHGNNPEIIHILEENHIEIVPKECLLESIKCHHNNIANYIQNVYMEDSNVNLNQIDLLKHILKLYNYQFFPENFNEKHSFYYLCKYDYVFIVSELLKSSSVDINEMIIRIKIVLIQF